MPWWNPSHTHSLKHSSFACKFGGPSRKNLDLSNVPRTAELNWFFFFFFSFIWIVSQVPVQMYIVMSLESLGAWKSIRKKMLQPNLLLRRSFILLCMYDGSDSLHLGDYDKTKGEHNETLYIWRTFFWPTMTPNLRPKISILVLWGPIKWIDNKLGERGVQVFYFNTLVGVCESKFGWCHLSSTQGKTKGGKSCIWAQYLSFIEPKNLKIVCNPKDFISTWFDNGISSFKHPELV